MYSIEKELKILRQFVKPEHLDNGKNWHCYSEDEISMAEERLHITRPKREISVYRPVIDGLNHKDTLEPSRSLFVLTLKSTKEKNQTRLYDLYRNCEREYFIPLEP